MKRTILAQGLALAIASIGALGGCTTAGGDAPESEPRDLASAEDPIGLDDSAGIITSVELASTGGEYLGTYMTHHPVRVSVTLNPTTAPADHHVFFGLVEKVPDGVSTGEVRTCLLGDVRTNYGVNEGETAQPVTITTEAVIPADCLADESQTGTFNLWIGVDPAMEADQTTFPEYNTQFFNAAAIDMNGDNRNVLCTGPNGEANCVMDIVVNTSSGHNVEVAKAELKSSIGAVEDACPLDSATPLLTAHSTLRIFGSAAHEGDTLEEAARNALQLAAGAGAAVDVSYSLCPRGDEGPDGAAPCAAGTSYAPLLIGNVDPNGTLVATAQVDHLTTAEPHELTHDLHAEPEGETCGRIHGVAGAAEDWSGHSTFNLRVCAAAPFSEVRDGGEPLEDNCRVIPVQIVRGAVGGGEQGSSLQYAKRYDFSFGGSVVSVSGSVGTDNLVNLNGAQSKNWARANLGGWFSKSLVNIWADGAAYVVLPGSYVDAGVEIFGTKYWQHKQTLNEIHYSSTPVSYSKSYCLYYNYGILGLGLNVGGCLQGNAGITISFDVVSKDGNGLPPFATATRVGEATAAVTPFASLNLVLSAYANLGIVKGGVTGNLTLASINLPAQAQLRWGAINNGSALQVQASAGLYATLSSLGGNVSAWVEGYKPAWCSCGKWCPGYPCMKWSNWYRGEVARWTGKTWGWTLLSASQQTTLQ